MEKLKRHYFTVVCFSFILVVNASEFNETIYTNNGTIEFSTKDLSNNTVVISAAQSGYLQTEPNILQDENHQNESSKLNL